MEEVPAAKRRPGADTEGGPSMPDQPTKTPRRTKTRFTGVYKSISGSYEILYRDSDGRLRSQAVAGSLEDAKTTRADIISKLGKGERVAPTKLTFEVWAEQWLASLDKRPRTISAHRYAL